MAALDRWSCNTVTAVWEFSWMGFKFTVFDKFPSYKVIVRVSLALSLKSMEMLSKCLL